MPMVSSPFKVPNYVCRVLLGAPRPLSMKNCPPLRMLLSSGINGSLCWFAMLTMGCEQEQMNLEDNSAQAFRWRVPQYKGLPENDRQWNILRKDQSRCCLKPKMQKRHEPDICICYSLGAFFTFQAALELSVKWISPGWKHEEKKIRVDGQDRAGDYQSPQGSGTLEDPSCVLTSQWPLTCWVSHPGTPTGHQQQHQQQEEAVTPGGMCRQPGETRKAKISQRQKYSGSLCRHLLLPSVCLCVLAGKSQKNSQS